VTYLDYSHSDNNLLDLEKETIKEDDRAVLLEGGLPRSASAKFHSSAIKMNLIRLLATLYAVLSWSFLYANLLKVFFLTSVPNCLPGL
jgi:hypothetical protein